MGYDGNCGMEGKVWGMMKTLMEGKVWGMNEIKECKGKYGA